MHEATADNALPSRFGTYRALQHREFRLLWIGLVVSAVGTWMQIVAQAMLVLKLTHGSAVALGIVSLAHLVLLSFCSLWPAGAWDRRQLLLITQSISATLAILLGVLTVGGVIRVWMIVVLAFLSGAVLSFDQPARGALVSSLVPHEHLMNAISLQTMVFNGASMLGPVLAGLSLGKFGFAGNFFLNGASYLGILLALFAMRLPPSARQAEDTSAAIRDGLLIIRHDSALPWVLSGYAALLFFGPSPALVLPVYAVTVLHVGPERLGLLFSCVGAGTIAGALTLASRPGDAGKGRLFFTGVFLWVSALAVFAVSRSFWISMLALLLFGAGQNFAGTTAITLLQTRVARHQRGRAMSFNTLLVMGLRPLGDFPAGTLIAIIGAPETVLLSAGVVAAYVSFLWLTKPVIRSV
ncbi:MAG TPA: MFS transporter [Terriglobales bacterium]